LVQFGAQSQREGFSRFHAGGMQKFRSSQRAWKRS
jgi:hypothetical protein